MRYSLRWFFWVACLWAIGCQGELAVPVSLADPPTSLQDPESVPFSDIIDLTVGIQEFRNVQVLGALRYEIMPLGDSISAGDEGTARSYSVFIHADIRFRRSQDYTMAQRWSAGGKSGDRVMLDTGTMALLTKSYQIWSIPNEAYINIIYGVTLTSVDVRILWVSYEPLPSESRGTVGIIPPF